MEDSGSSTGGNQIPPEQPPVENRWKARRSAAISIAIGSVLICAAAPFFGPSIVSPLVLFVEGPDNLDRAVLLQLRIPRVLLGYLAGAVFAVGGVVFQAVFRNPLATPYTLGVASGAALGAALGMSFGGSLLPEISGIDLLGSAIPICALIGAFTSVVIVLGCGKGASPTTFLLIGVIVSFFLSSLTLLVQYLSSLNEIFQITRWLMGSVEVVGYSSVLWALPLVLAGLIIVAVNFQSLDLMAMGDDLAMSRGLEVKRVRLLVLVGASAMVAGIVSICGPIGFIGLIVPHLCRVLCGARHGPLLFAGFFGGGALLVFFDSLARSVIAPAEIPVGVITALVGGPFFLLLLRRGVEFRP